jgi:hypothetical protein
MAVTTTTPRRGSPVIHTIRVNGKPVTVVTLPRRGPL